MNQYDMSYAAVAARWQAKLADETHCPGCSKRIRPGVLICPKCYAEENALYQREQWALAYERGDVNSA